MEKAYSKKIELQMLNVYQSLSEKDRRHYAAIEAIKLGYGGVTYISRVLKCNHEVISRGKKEITNNTLEKSKRIRRVGGGRKSMLDTMTGIGDAFLKIIDNSTAGSPMDDTIKWTNLSRAKMALKLEEEGFKVSVTVIDKLLKKYNFCPRKAFKNQAGKENIPNRDEQFKNLDKIRANYIQEGNPVISMDVKKKN